MYQASHLAHRRVASLNLSLITAPIATVLALALIPENTASTGALLWSAWALTFGLLAGLVNDLVRRGPLGALRAQHLLMVAVVVISYGEALQLFYSVRLDAKDIKAAYFAIGLFGTCVSVGSSLPLGKLPPAVRTLANRQYPAKTVFRILLICWCLQMLNYAYASDFSIVTMVNALFLSRWAAPWARGALGGWDAFRDFLTNFGYVVPTFAVVLVLTRRTWRSTDVIVSFLCSGISLAFFAQTGARRLFVVILGAAMLTWFVSKRRVLRLRYYIAALVVIIATILFADFILAQRRLGYEEISYSRSDFEGVKLDNNLTMLGETIRAIPSEVDYVGLSFPWYILVRPIPRVFWPGKPVDPGFDLAQHLGASGVTFSITGIGEAYMSFGWVGVVAAGLLLGWWAASWSQVLDWDSGVTGAALYGLGAMALFLTVRSFIELVLTTYPIICWFAIDFMFSRSRSRKRLAAGRRTLEGTKTVEAR
jgi:oligosaccharide repeat unit polymerase